MSRVYLVDSTVTETNAIKLKLITEDGETKEVIDPNYKPYFLALHPLTDEEMKTVNLFSGNVETTVKTDLFTKQSVVLSKIRWPNLKAAILASDHFRQTWEKEISFPKSYVYDKGMIFGALHRAEDLRPICDIQSDTSEKFEDIFKKVKDTDNIKYSQIAYWFNLLAQPIPTVGTDLFGARQAEPEIAHSIWVLARIANLPLAEAVNSKRVSNWLKSIIYTYLRKNNILIPSAEELTRGKQTHRVAGALTVAPRAGAYFNTVVCDFESLYPSCIDSFNLSYETVNCPHEECRRNTVPDFEGHICTKHRGFYATLIGALKELRIKLFKPASKDRIASEEQRKDAQATARLLKLILVSSYGVTVRIHGLACPPLAEAITGYGRYALRESWDLAEAYGLRPLYGDTDSLFLDNVSDGQVEWLVERVKSRFHLDLAIEKRYNLCVLPKAKKAYFGILPDGTPDVKGVTAAKSNSPVYINKVFNQCLKELSTVKSKDDLKEAGKRIKQAVRRGIADLRTRKISLADLVYSVKLYFDPAERLEEMQVMHQPYQCALQLADAGKPVGRGDMISFVKVKPFKYKGKVFTVKPANFVKDVAEINVEDYVRNLLTALNQAFEPMGIEVKPEGHADISRWFAQ